MFNVFNSLSTREKGEHRLLCEPLTSPPASPSSSLQRQPHLNQFWPHCEQEVSCPTQQLMGQSPVEGGQPHPDCSRRKGHLRKSRP